ncbi:MAG TPA: hydrogenase nickel incorporation protein HypB [Terriglobia bacterium]|nr:hydrogenase nickel incorporation protein HypB [Terriglobia bacterium]
MGSNRAVAIGDSWSVNEQTGFSRFCAKQNRATLEAAGIFGVNLMAAPGAGKTSLILRTAEALSASLRIGVVEATPASVGLETGPFSEAEIPMVQVSTGGRFQLDAATLNPALKQLPLASIDILLVENIGNLVCHGASQLGLQTDVLVVSVPEGHDNPYKYPEMYRHIDAVILNKTDLLPWVSFDLEFFRRGVELLNPSVSILPLSCYTGADLHRWIDWLISKRKITPSIAAARSGR